MATIVKSGSALMPIGVLTIALCALAGCSKLQLSGQSEMAWARAALERNPSLEVVATDQQSGSFTVRLKGTGSLRVVRADQLMAGLPTAAVAEAAGAPTAAEAPAGPQGGVAPGSAATGARNETAASAGSEAPGEQTAPADAEAAPAARIADVRPAVPVATAAPVESASPGHVLASGPGYTIKAAPRAGKRAGAAPGSGSTALVERRHEPIVCQGDRFLQIDNRNLEFDGDAVSAEDGCEIHITNSRIAAKGVGVMARKANVHIENSQIEGDSGSVDASEGAQVYASSSTFKGLRRRLDDAVFHDMGGNVWN